MTSILKADNIQDADGNNIINESSNTITIGASGDTISIPSGATIANSGTATGFGGITMADQWRLTADNSMSSSGNQDITSNWERNDNSGFGQLGSGMTESSGIFTFPSTGIYLIKIVFDVIAGGSSGADIAADVKINTTVNNSDYTQQTATYASMHGNGVYSVGMAEFIFDVTDTSTHKCKFRYYRSTSGSILRGSTSQNETHATFIRLGDT